MEEHNWWLWSKQNWNGIRRNEQKKYSKNEKLIVIKTIVANSITRMYFLKKKQIVWYYDMQI
jgi:hypothetical protein